MRVIACWLVAVPPNTSPCWATSPPYLQAQPAHWLPLELGDLARWQCAQAFWPWAGHCTAFLILNASWRASGPQRLGFEMAFGVNHLGHFALTQVALLPCLQAPAPARAITVASKMHLRGQGPDWDCAAAPHRQPDGRVPEYKVSKLANVLFATELARRPAGTGGRAMWCTLALWAGPRSGAMYRCWCDRCRLMSA